jgi:hypothetical protein
LAPGLVHGGGIWARLVNDVTQLACTLFAASAQKNRLDELLLPVGL